jgi:hypothetical protein
MTINNIWMAINGVNRTQTLGKLRIDSAQKPVVHYYHLGWVPLKAWGHPKWEFRIKHSLKNIRLIIDQNGGRERHDLRSPYLYVEARHGARI